MTSEIQKPGPSAQASIFRSGFAAIVGEANSGKSTLLNSLLGEKVAIVTPKPQTTRNRIMGVKTSAAGQIVFLDTPGFVRESKRSVLNRALTAELVGAASEVDLMLLVVDGYKASHDQAFAEALFGFFSRQKLSQPAVIALNKIDLIEKPLLLPLMAKLIEAFGGEDAGVAVVPVSALEADGLAELESEILQRLPEGPQLFEADTLSDQSEKFWVSEIVREKLFLELNQELPYSVAVKVEKWEETAALLRIHAVIFVERDSQKGIIIGKGGKKLKSIGSAARLEIEKVLGTKVYLELFVRVEKDWAKTEKGLRKTGFSAIEG